MRTAALLALVLAALAAGCATALSPVAVPVPARSIDYLSEVKPLLDKRCTVCHSCYNSPCQLKLDSYEGADRGATKSSVFSGLNDSIMIQLLSPKMNNPRMPCPCSDGKRS